jgi:NAD(P)-dependent dehydrogenase (short-subunit alcohol dehydrogenase family)
MFGTVSADGAGHLVAVNESRDTISCGRAMPLSSHASTASRSYVANEALAAMAQGLGSELGPRVRVNVVAPAFMDTALWRAKPREDVDARIDSYSKINPLGRLGTPQ